MRTPAKRPVFKRQPLASCLAAAGSLMLSPVVLADHELLTVVVTADAIPQSTFSIQPAAALEELQKAPGGVAVVDAADYLNGRAGTMEDSLKLATGVFIASRFGSDEARVSIRGSGLQRTFHGRGLQLLQDGVPVNLADGSFDMQAIEPQATRYIEIERGANALRYGGGTLGGAINYISQTGRGAAPLSLRAETGSDGYQRYNLSTGGVRDALDGHASFNFLEQDGFRDHARQRNSRFAGNVGLQLSDRVESRFYLTALDVDSELPGNLTYAQLKDNPKQASARAVARDQHRDFTLYRLANRTDIRHGDTHRTEVTSYVTQKQLFHPIEFFPTGPGLIEQENRDWGLGLRHLVDTRWLGGRQEHVAGVQWHHGLTLDERYTYARNTFVPGVGFAVGRQRGTLDNRQKQTADGVDVYGQSSWQLSPVFTAIVGVQSSLAKRRQTVLVDNVGFDPATQAVRLATGGYEESYQRTSPRLGFIYRPAEHAEIYGNLSGSFEPPSFSETLNNKPLKAQRAMTGELGIRGNQRKAGTRLGWDLSLYRAAIRNELLSLQVGSAPVTTNADRTLHQGVEAGVSLENNHWRGQASYLYNDFRFQNDARLGSNDIAGLPTQVLNADVAARLPHGIWLGPTVRAASRSWVDHANTLAAPGYSVYGLKLNQELPGGLSWFVESRNLTDKRYAATTGVINKAIGNDAQFSPGEGRGLYVGVSKAF